MFVMLKNTFFDRYQEEENYISAYSRIGYRALQDST